MSYASPADRRWSYGLGTRVERTDYVLSLRVDDEDALEDQYVNVFPTARLHFDLSDRQSLSLVYSSRVERPPYQDLNPNLIYQDPYTSIQGNPRLVPAVTQGLEIIADFDGTTFKAGHRYIDRPLAGAALRGATSRSYILQRLNFTRRFEWSFELSRAFEIGPWTSSTTISANRTKVFAEDLDVVYVPPRWQPYVFTDHRIDLNKLGAVEMQAWYAGAFFEGTFNRFDAANLTLTYERKWLDGNLTTRVILNDVFNTQRASGLYNVDGTDIYFDNKWRSNFVRLAFTYSFGKITAKRFQNQQTGEQERGRIR